MHYLIDGYNLIGKIPGISFADPAKEEKLVLYLGNRLQKQNDAFDLIFDGKRTESLFGSQYQTSRFRIKFTPSDQSADDYLIEYMEKIRQKTGVVIVSSDRQIIQAAKNFRIQTMKSESFVQFYQNEPVPGSVKQPISIISETEIQYWLKRFI